MPERCTQIQELTPNRFSVVRPLFGGLLYNLVIDSVIEGNTPGKVYVDDPAAPRTAVLWNRMDALFLAGEPGSPSLYERINRLVRQSLIPDASQRGVPNFSINYDPPGWKTALPAILAGYLPRPVARRCFRFEGRLRVPQPEPHSGLHIAPLEVGLLLHGSLRNTGSVMGWILSFWHSLDEFLENGVGFCVHDEAQIASWCLSVFASRAFYDRPQLELGIATEPALQGRGLASAAAAACLDYCQQQGIEPHWHCDVNNHRSARVAEKVGFVPLLDYEVQRIWFA